MRKAQIPLALYFAAIIPLVAGAYNSFMGLSETGGSGAATSALSRPRKNAKDTPPAGSAASSSNTIAPIRVAYQGEPGAYSEKATRELLGRKVIAIGRPNFEACFRAVASMECDYACLPVENSLGGSIHENYDLMLRYDLTIVAEHEFRVSHCLLVHPSIKNRGQIKYAISHPQALAQCDNYLRGLGITPIPTYDTAGAAKMLADGTPLPDKCTQQNTAAIASDLAGKTHGLKCLGAGIEDDDTNFTRFLLLGRKSVVQWLRQKKIPCKTSIVFTLGNTMGALYKALACFALRDIDFSKIESRPTSASLLNYLKFKSQQMGGGHSGTASSNKADLRRFRYCFYLDFLDNELSEKAQHAMEHLREQAEFCRVLGSYPQQSRLVGPVAAAAEELKQMEELDEDVEWDSIQHSLPSDTDDTPLRIGVLGFGAFGQFLAKKFVEQKHKVACIDQLDKSKEADSVGADFYPMFDMRKFLADTDVLVLAIPMIQFEDAVTSIPADQLSGKLVVEVCPLSTHPKNLLLRHMGQDVDILSSHPMFGPTAGSVVSDEDEAFQSALSSKKSHWEGQPMVYERVRVSDVRRCDKFLGIFERARCNMVEMTAEDHDANTADAEFVTHLTGRLLVRQLLPPTPVTSKEYSALCDVADLTSGDSFDLFFGMFKYNPHAKEYLDKMRENLSRVERQLAAKEAYLEASAAMKNTDRQRLIQECKSLLQEVVADSQRQETIVQKKKKAEEKVEEDKNKNKL